MADFLQPISDDQPSGEYLRYDPVYDEIRDARRTEEADASMGIWQPLDAKGADWDRARQLCEEVLTSRSKDLQVAYWLTEALLHLESFGGAAQGLEVMAQLCEHFWPTLHPEIDEDDLDFRLAPIRQASRELPVLLLNAPLTSPRSGQIDPVTANDYVIARRGDNENMTVDTIRQSFADSDPNSLRTLLEQVAATEQSLKQLDTICEQHCGYQTPSFADITAALSEVRDAINNNTELTEAAPTDTESPASTMMMGTISGGATGVQFDTSRNGCYQMLDRALKTFEIGEPHSPVVPILRHLVVWKDKGLHEIAEKLESRGSSLADIMKAFPASTKDPEPEEY